jgi:hypothetical protein
VHETAWHTVFQHLNTSIFQYSHVGARGVDRKQWKEERIGEGRKGMGREGRKRNEEKGNSKGDYHYIYTW